MGQAVSESYAAVCYCGGDETSLHEHLYEEHQPELLPHGQFEKKNAQWIDIVNEIDDKKKHGHFSVDSYFNEKGKMLYIYYLTMFQHKSLKNEANWLMMDNDSMHHDIEIDEPIKDIFESACLVYEQLSDIDEKRMFLQMVWCSIVQDDGFVDVEREWLDAVGKRTVREPSKRRGSQFEKWRLDQAPDMINDIGTGMHGGSPFVKKVYLLKFCMSVGRDIGKMDKDKWIVAKFREQA